MNSTNEALTFSGHIRPKLLNQPRFKWAIKWFYCPDTSCVASIPQSVFQLTHLYAHQHTLFPLRLAMTSNVDGPASNGCLL